MSGERATSESKRHGSSGDGGWVGSEKIQGSREGRRQAGERTMVRAETSTATSRPAARETLSEEWTMVDPRLTSHCAVVGRVGGVRKDTRQSGGM